MANKQRGPLPPVMSTEETRVKPLEEDEEELPPEEPSWDPQRDQTQLLPKASPPPAWDGVDEMTPPVPRKIDPVPYEDDPDLQGPDDATRPIPRKAAARLTPPPPPDDATRPIPRKTGTRPVLQTPDDATRPIPRKTGTRPALPDLDDATRPIPRKTGTRPALPDQDDATRNIPRKSGSVPTLPREPQRAEAAVPWQPQEEDEAALPTIAQILPPMISGPAQALVSPPDGPPVLIPVNTEPHYILQAPIVPPTQPHRVPLPPPAPISLVTHPNHSSPPPPAAIPLLTQPTYVPPPPAVLNPVVTAPHLVPALHPAPQGMAPPGEEIRTTFSNKAAMVADLVKATFARRSYGMAPYRLRIDEPDGPSTAGGLHARQPISLVSNMESAPAVVCGWVDVARKEAQLRSYGVVVKRHLSRYTAGLDITEEEYDRFLNELVETLFYGGIRILVQVPDDPEPQQMQGGQSQSQQQQRSGGSRMGTLFLVMLTFALGVGVGMNKERLAPVIDQVKALLGR